MLRPALQTARNVRAARSFQTSAARRAAHGDSKYDTHESFFTGPWIHAGILFALGVTAYNFLPAPKEVVAAPVVNTDALEADAKDASLPWLTRFLSGRIAETADNNDKYNDKHLALAVDVADQRLLFNEAEMPKVRRLTYPSLFEQQSPNCVGVGTEVNLSDLVVKTEEQ
ncbi:hypothetical protein CcaverHIS002_0602470 [Cutaneotrichosporon cavernicola]|uniref:Uncharacterized protein n=1 Tax=Cutaneotrichosporon cavernicola TaxID=279322 RepID=A0AA48QXU3_9TREE|nr:uncharacterized protein CcaverHIS019_0601960 [Cutaneotrichosporon cavernicola]BEI85960.1 hypothetical protein CcaverHIS002_0602470 [Cutaneotrichosporon cavernicola]BEI93737.1 hypothetical protein CcaverHIS019_0601960 [Cutaneotrichosporon cavernicola]BEJ01515.1 hypothetical protein CcaverHIS631_0601970 [Cutaneotrichosporon cavernicola]BEJ09280.1 hypothetical protein CcaverHIS641_0601950 [Cutaneotrichosporon cavernicola]